MITVNSITDKLPMPNFDLPKFNLLRFDLPKFDLPKVDVSRATDVARDAAYIGVGAFVMSVQTADERRRAIGEQIAGQFRKVVSTTGW